MAATIARIALRPSLRSLPARLACSVPLIQSRVSLSQVSSRPAVLTSVNVPSQVQTRGYSGADPLNLQYINDR